MIARPSPQQAVPSPGTNLMLAILPRRLRPFAVLARLDKPIGTWLLLWPGLWSVALAAPALPDMRLLALFAAGALVMRSAGCVYNDIVDRDFDARVARTRSRPIASGAIGVKTAILFLAVLLALGLVILLHLNTFAVIIGAASLALVFTYPFMKRITYWPQAFLGLTFNWGALLGWAAVEGGLAWPAGLLYAGGIAWTLGYDTIYAHQDKEDDALIGVKSTALALGEKTKPWIHAFYLLAVAGFAAAGALADIAWPFYAGLGAASLLFMWQAATLKIDDARDCLAKFKLNFWVGAVLFAGIVGARAWG
ncbi:MAG: 4-hydroxybenzoate octaprenyltransferase [Alphaproteobacteria bacterium]|nr:4-hydroxybenzoate octaprenyltransferase [Alphaproteobacteria bacterium]